MICFNAERYLSYDKTVICRKYPCRKFFKQFIVAWKLVGKMSEPGMSGPNLLSYIECSLK